MQTLTRFSASIALLLAQFAPAAAAQANWKPITAGGMTVSMPCTADWETKTQEVPEEAAVVTSHLLGCKAGDAFYLIQWTEIETTAQLDGMAALRSSRDAMVRQAGGGTLITSNDITHDGLKGIEFTANLRGSMLLSSRSVFHGKRMYLVSVGTPLNQDRSADISRLLKSLKVKR